MIRSRPVASIAAGLLLSLLAPGCGGVDDERDAKATAAWELYRRSPDGETFANFVRANRTAAAEHGNPHDALGIEYQVRALEAMVQEAERTHDASMADEVLDGVRDIERKELTAVYEEVLRGSKDRIAATKARADRVVR